MIPVVGRIRWPLAALLLVFVLADAAKARDPDQEVIVLTQTGCQFLEPEGADHKFDPKRAADCEKINRETGTKRLADHEVLVLKPGRYVFRVANVNVPYELGFYLRARERSLIPFKPRVSGGGLHMGEVQDYPIELSTGEYVYSCPYNPTPNYKLVVR